MKFAVVCIAALLSLSLAACSSSQNTSTSSSTEAPAAPAATAMATAAAMMKGAAAKGMMAANNMMAAMKPVTVTLAAQNGSGESGTATLTAVGKTTKVVIALTGAPATAQPAHIHAGPCAKLNPVPKWPLMSVVGGKSTTVVNTPLSSLTGNHWSINVHDSAANLKKYVACGDIK